MAENCDTTPLVGYDDALALLTGASATAVGMVEVDLLDAAGRILARDIESAIDVPGCAMSAMDGYAVSSRDLDDAATSLPVSQRIPAGSAAKTLAPGSVARIFTGAPLPEGADAVVMQEQAQADGDRVAFSARPAAGANVRAAGNDIRAGTLILRRGQRLRAQDIGLAASTGLKSLPVRARLRVGIFFTGDELAEPGQPIPAHKIYDSNRYTLNGLLEALGCEVVDMGIVGDSLEATEAAMRRASTRAQLVITSGGVSVGEEDHVRVAIESQGELRLWRLGIKPGKPLAFGKIGDTAFLGLPGNPVSVFATFYLFVCPVIAIMQGRDWQKPLPIPVIANFDRPQADSRREFLRARLERDADGRTVAAIYPNQDSGVLTSTVWADGFVEIGENRTVKRGDTVDYLPFARFFD